MTESRSTASPRLPRIRKRRGRCFELAAKGQLQDPSWTLVHGVIREWICHAWLLKGEEVYDPVLDELLPASEYRERESAEPERACSAEEAAHILADEKYWGPWHETAGTMQG